MAAAYDVIVIGGGVTGAGVARDCAMRGLKALVLEKNRPGCGTTGVSTHLIHGGLRYLLYDRLTTHATCWDSGHILRIARPLLQRLPILWPIYAGQSHGSETVETLLEVYDGFQRMKGGKPHLRLSAAETLALVPGLKAEGLKGAVSFDEWWVDPVGLVEANLASARRYGGELRAQSRVVRLMRRGRAVVGVETDAGPVEARLVVNAAGPWIDKVARLAGLSIPMRLQKGTHLVYRERLVPVGLLLETVPRGRFVFVVPSPQGTLVGPTDLPGPEDPDKVGTDPAEVDYLLASVRSYLPDFPRDYDGTIVGSRPILGQAGSEKLLSREYEVFDHAARDGVEGLVTIGGGKMSDFRVMAEAAVDASCRKLGLKAPCRTHLETLEGGPVGDIPSFPRPWRPLKRFLRDHPRLRELHAMAHLGLAFGRHVGRKALGLDGLSDAAAFRAHYND